MASVIEQDKAVTEPLTIEQATTILAEYQELWNRGAMSELLDGFTEDIIVEFADLPPIRGRKELEQMIQARTARQKGYRLEKTLRCVFGSTIVCSWTAEWTDGLTGRLMKGKGIEFLQHRDGKCCRWDSAFNAWDSEAPARSLFV